MAKLKLVYQRDAFDCGIACLQMILGFYGSEIEIPRTHVGGGLSFLKLIRLAKQYNLGFSAYFTKKLQIIPHHGPSILHWNHNHFVVLERIDPKKGYRIFDPSEGVYWLSEKVFTSQFTGFVLDLVPTQHYQRCIRHANHSIFEVFSHVPCVAMFSMVIIFSTLLIQISMILIPVYYQRELLCLLIHHSVNGIESILIVIAVVKMAEILLSVCKQSARVRLNKLIAKNIPKRLYHHLFRMSFNYLNCQIKSSLFLRFNSVEKIKEILNADYLEGIIEVLLSLGIIGIFYYLNLKIGLLVSLFSTLYLFAHLSMAFSSRGTIKYQLTSFNRAAGYLLEVMNHISVIKKFHSSDFFYQRWCDWYQKYVNASSAIANLQVKLSGIRNVIFSIEILLLVYFYHQELTGFYLSFFYLSLLNKSLPNICIKITNTNDLLFHANEINAILHQPCEKEDQIALSSIRSIQLKRISFRYHNDAPWILNDFSYQFDRGEHVAILGTSGSGKSTLLKILTGQEFCHSGITAVNNVDIKLQLKAYRKLIASVTQNDVIFSGTILQNICLNDNNIDYAYLQRCIELTELREIIDKLPMGYQTYLDAESTVLSSGQIQRLLLSRALYTKPQFLFLDEAYCHLDRQSVITIDEAIKQRGITRILVTHRELHSASDRIIELDAIKYPQANRQKDLICASL